MSYATTTTGHVDHTRVSKDTRLLKEHYLLGTHVTVRQNSTITTEEWRGLNYTDASAQCVTSETSVLSGTSRPYLGSVNVSVTSGLSTGSIYVSACWGTKVTSQLEKMSDTNLYRVVKTTETLSLSIPQGTVTYL